MAPVIMAVAPVIHTIKIAVEAPTIVVASIVVASIVVVSIVVARMFPTMAVGAARMFPTVEVADDVDNRLPYRTQQWVRAVADV